MSTIGTSAQDTATAYSNQRKIDRTSNGVLWTVRNNQANGSTVQADLAYSTNNGSTWTDGGTVLTGGGGTSSAYLTNASFFIDPDDYAHIAFKDKSDGRIYYRRGTPNAGRTAWTWSTATALRTDDLCDFPDLVAHREGTGWRAHVVYSLQSAGSAQARGRSITVASGGGLTLATEQVLSATYSTSGHTYPSIDFNHTGDGKTVAGGTPHLYVAWSAGATGAGLGIRFKKATYSGGSWTWGTEVEIDSTLYVDTAGARWLNCLFDGTRVCIIGRLLNSTGSAASVMLYERDAADTVTTTRPLINPDDATTSVLRAGSATYDSRGNLYIFGADFTGANGTRKLNYRVWTRATLTLGGINTIETSASDAPYISAKRGYSGNKIEYVYTDGTASPYTVTYNNISLSLGGAIGAITETDTSVPVTRRKRKALATTASSDAAQPVARRKAKALAVVTETDTAVPITRRPNNLQATLAVVTETDTALAFGKIDPIQRPLVPVLDTASAVTIRPTKRRSLTLATEVDQALPATYAKAVLKFSPPVAQELMSTSIRLFNFFTQPISFAVVRRHGHYVSVRVPTQEETDALVEGTSWFTGGRTYEVSPDTATLLQADGFEVTRWLVPQGA